jgi:hypothetical protein
VVKRGYWLCDSGCSADGGSGLVSGGTGMVAGLRRSPLIVGTKGTSVASGLPYGVNGLAAVVGCVFGDCREAMMDRGSLETSIESGDGVYRNCALAVKCGRGLRWGAYRRLVLSRRSNHCRYRVVAKKCVSLCRNREWCEVGSQVGDLALASDKR